MKIACNQCGATCEFKTYRTFIQCPFCKSRRPAPKFAYCSPDWKSDMYAGVALWMDCPACRSSNMYLGPEKKKWNCPDCGYSITEKEKDSTVFWFCDDCDTFLNIQDGFSTKTGRWICTECGLENDVTGDNIT